MNLSKILNKFNPFVNKGDITVDSLVKKGMNLSQAKKVVQLLKELDNVHVEIKFEKSKPISSKEQKPDTMKALKEESLFEETDFKDINFDGIAATIAKKYVDNYKERSGKEFTSQAAAALKRGLSEKVQDPAKVEAIVKAAREYAKIPEAKSHAVRSKESNEKKKEQKGEKDEIMSKNVGSQAKKAHDVFKTMKEEIMYNSGLKLINEAEGSKEEQIAFINKMKAKLKSDFSELVKEEIATEKDEQGKDFIKDAIKVIKKEVFGNMVYRLEEDLSLEFDKVLLSKKEIADLLKTILSNKLTEAFISESKGSKVAKCPDCGKKYIVAIGHKCEESGKKIAPSVSTDGGTEGKSKKKVVKASIETDDPEMKPKKKCKK